MASGCVDAQLQHDAGAPQRRLRSRVTAAEKASKKAEAVKAARWADEPQPRAWSRRASKPGAHCRNDEQVQESARK